MYKIKVYSPIHNGKASFLGYQLGVGNQGFYIIVTNWCLCAIFEYLCCY